MIEVEEKDRLRQGIFTVLEKVFDEPPERFPKALSIALNKLGPAYRQLYDEVFVGWQCPIEERPQFPQRPSIFNPISHWTAIVRW
ncbi:MAG: hypothetical protein ACD_38C00062G0002 [uncultured bacterium]|uniref:Uncharacterized protein n=1 Tax=Candidatus Daviesbacteria bacterium GW2011_GWC2_40_12 TaxID=1618431 RepID=A0A0G0T358_9BACT|nr:MAG: hypothetical protein ACD_38C00062G0002 [uncultured bacterium]KKQ81810.1 MAG: hypothetical protein UT04_C0065G0002 [Candidatus Daviesbacteria bacterium GW2011_GWF2_38_7]KKR15947.1 MAG: hypothetical protein UT45_C0011G0030 [Candidatus Daviesbacteria bacterium GW2011_GWA2_39_33]KKR22322.1 MAG: hypothetical protein UT54_C0071G0008 [Candidatus Daviesbacteria bacterium GW2011_GWB1_39_5]KKR41555.1 MAG: hypothetical protein UT77_C0009G0013 [Candidatus Daviesbacteria bacterium GW2011_GWC2_40_12]